MKVQSQGWKDTLEESTATSPNILDWRIPWTEEPGGYSPQGRKESDMTERLHFLSFVFIIIILYNSQGYWDDLGKAFKTLLGSE